MDCTDRLAEWEQGGLVELTDADLAAAISRNVAELDAYDPNWRDWPVPCCRHVHCFADEHREVGAAIRGLDTGWWLKGSGLFAWLARRREAEEAPVAAAFEDEASERTKS